MRLSIPLFTAVIFLFVLACHRKNQDQRTFKLSGKIEGLENQLVTLAKLDLISNERIYIDSVMSQHGAFSFQGKLESPYLHTLLFQHQDEKIHFFLEPGVIDLSGNMDNLEFPKITGSREDSLFRSHALEDIFDRQKGMEIMLQHPDYVYAAFTAYYQFQIHNIHPDTLALIMNNFSRPVQESIYYQHLLTLYETIQRVAIGRPAPLFSIKDTSGQIVHINDFKGQYVLIDFWASWCAPCRETFPSLIEVYNELSQHPFEIVGISVDKEDTSWKKAIVNDQLPWVNLSNVNGWDTVAETYGVKAVPQNFLLDPNGIIMYKNIEPSQLLQAVRNELTSD